MFMNSLPGVLLDPIGIHDSTSRPSMLTEHGVPFLDDNMTFFHTTPCFRKRNRKMENKTKSEKALCPPRTNRCDNGAVKSCNLTSQDFRSQAVTKDVFEAVTGIPNVVLIFFGI